MLLDTLNNIGFVMKEKFTLLILLATIIWHAIGNMRNGKEGDRVAAT